MGVFVIKNHPVILCLPTGIYFTLRTNYSHFYHSTACEAMTNKQVLVRTMFYKNEEYMAAHANTR